MVQEHGRGPTVLSSALEIAAMLSLLLFSPARAVFADSSSTATGENPALTDRDRALVASVPYSNAPLLNRTGRFDTRFSIPPETDWREIYERPRIVSLSIAEVPGSRERQVSEGDVEGVFPVEARYLYQALAAYSDYPRISPRTVFDAERSTLVGPFVYHKRVQKVSAQFLGFGETYLFVTNNYEIPLTGSSWGLKWNLEESLDGKLFSLMGSWYVRQIDCNGEACSYLRYFTHTGLTSPPPVPHAILGFVTSISYRQMLIDFYHEALRIRAERRGGPGRQVH